MKKITLSVLAVLAISASISSCKKGEEDPGFTLLSRKARVAGEWKITSLSETSSSSISPYSNFGTTPAAGLPYTVSKETSHNGSTLTMSSTGPGANNSTVTVTSSGTVNEHTYVIEKDGSWSSVMKTLVSSTETKMDFYGKTYTESTTTTTEINASGTWDFLSGIGDDYKNKERIALSTIVEDITTSTVFVVTPGTSTLVPASTTQSVSTDNYTYDANKNVAVWQITQLKNKEMKVESSFESSSKGREVITSSTFNDENKSADVTTTGTSKITFSVNK